MSNGKTVSLKPRITVQSRSPVIRPDTKAPTLKLGSVLPLCLYRPIGKRDKASSACAGPSFPLSPKGFIAAGIIVIATTNAIDNICIPNAPKPVNTSNGLFSAPQDCKGASNDSAVDMPGPILIRLAASMPGDFSSLSVVVKSISFRTSFACKTSSDTLATPS